MGIPTWKNHAQKTADISTSPCNADMTAVVKNFYGNTKMGQQLVSARMTRNVIQVRKCTVGNAICRSSFTMQHCHIDL